MDLVAQLPQLAIHPAIAPAGVLLGHPQHQVADHPLLGGGGAGLPAAVAVVLPGDQPAVPLQQRVGAEERADLPQEGDGNALGSRGQPAFLGVVEDEALVAQLLPEYPVLFPEVADRVLPLPVSTTVDGHHEERPWLPDHGTKHSIATNSSGQRHLGTRGATSVMICRRLTAEGEHAEILPESSSALLSHDLGAVALGT
jgi:hypothetical protein